MSHRLTSPVKLNFEEMSAAIPIIGTRCHSCSKFYPESGLMTIGESIKRCFACQEKHEQALDVLAGNPPRSCGECGATWEEIKRRDSNPEAKMYVHMKDGVYQLLCDLCDEEYVRKRKDLYGPTRFGWERKLN